MRGRKPSVLSLAPPTKTVCTQPLIVTACPGIKCGGPEFCGSRCRSRKRDVAARMECGVATVWRACERYRRDGLEGLLADGREGRSGRLERITPVQRADSWNWPVWNQLPRACTSPIGPARTWLVKPWRTASLARSVLQRFAGCCTMWICSPIAPDIGRRPVWMPSSKSKRSKSFGAMGMRSDWRNKASGSFVSMRSRPSRFWSVNPFAGRSPARLSTRSSTISAWDREHVVFLVVHTGLMELAFLAQNRQ